MCNGAYRNLGKEISEEKAAFAERSIQYDTGQESHEMPLLGEESRWSCWEKFYQCPYEHRYP
jgi:hypothetical protein